jgi:hypothetical protein
VCDGLDQDCDGVADDGLLVDWYPDADADGFGAPVPPTRTCAQPPSTARVAGDCDDAQASIHPGATEVCDGVDQDCDGAVDDGVLIVWFPDNDADGYGQIVPPQATCTQPAGTARTSGDCDDAVAETHPGAAEVCDAVDQDCDGVADEGVAIPLWVDADGDGFGVTDDGVVRGCAADVGLATAAGDCDDADAAVGAGCAPVMTGSWPTYGGDDARTGHPAGTVDGGALVELWDWTATDGYLLQPAIADGRVVLTLDDWYWGLDDHVISFDAATGAIQWDRPITGSEGPSAVTIEASTVYLQRIDSSDADAIALDETTGTPLWQTPFGAQWETYYAPLVMDGRLIMAGGTYGGMYSFNGTTGKQQWFVTGPQYWDWTPVGDGGVVYSLVSNLFTARNPATGATQWELSFANVPWLGYSMWTVPAVRDGDALVVLGGDLVAIDLVSHAERWRISDGFVGSPTVADGLVYAIRDGALIQVDQADGFLYRVFPGDGLLVGKPAVTDDVVVASSATATFVYQLWDGLELAELPTGGDLAVGEGYLVTVSGDTATTWAWQ